MDEDRMMVSGQGSEPAPAGRQVLADRSGYGGTPAWRRILRRNGHHVAILRVLPDWPNQFKGSPVKAEPRDLARSKWFDNMKSVSCQREDWRAFPSVLRERYGRTETV